MRLADNPPDRLAHQPSNQAKDRQESREYHKNEHKSGVGIIIEAIPGQTTAIGDQSNAASITPTPWPLSKALEIISGAKANKTTPGTDIATTENHIAIRAAPRFGQMRQTRVQRPS
jgi:hypothetical protein